MAPEDPTLLNPDLLFRLGWVPIGLALCGIVIGIWKMASQSRNGTPPPSSLQSPPPRLNPQLGHLFFMSGATAVFLFMALPVSLPLWENLPLIDFVQFPWRFVGRASLPVAFLAGVPFASFATEKARPWPPILASLAIFLLLLEVMPNLYPNYCLEESFPTIQTVHTYERETGLVGVDPEGSYFPRSVQKRPSGSPLETAYQQNQLPLRFDLPAQVRGTYIEVEPLGAVVEVESSEPFTAVYQSFAFAGWKATVDQEPVPIIPSVPLGLISFEVPAGRHTLSVQWGSTPLRSTLLGLSILSLAGTAVGALVLFSNQGSIGSQQLRATRKTKAAHQFSPPFYLLLTSLLLITLKFGLFDRLDTPFRQTGAHNLPPTPELRGGELQLTHYTLSQRAIPSDGVFEVRMAWQAAAAPTRSYQTNVWLEDEAGQLWSDKNTFRPRKYEDAPDTIFWPAGAWAWENWEIEPLSGTPEGSYKVVMTLFDLETLAPLTLTDQDGQSLGPTAVLGEVWITSPTTLPEFSPQFVLETAVPNTDFNLLGFNQDRTVAQPGEEMLITLFVEKAEERINQSLTLSLEDDRGNKLADWDIKPGLTTSADSRLRLQRVFRLPGGLDSGTYQFSLQETVKLGRIDINAPERLFEQPAFETAVNQTFSNKTDQINLVGYTQSSDQFPLSLDLVWQPLIEISTSYRVFVHLVTAEGQIVAQSDGEPANWRRPTTGWAIGEYIQDTHQLTLPPDADFDQLHLRVGLYNPETGSRLFVDGKDFIEIGR